MPLRALACALLLCAAGAGARGTPATATPPPKSTRPSPAIPSPGTATPPKTQATPAPEPRSLRPEALRLAPRGAAGTTARLAFLLERLDAGQTRLRHWWIAWMATYGALTAAQGAAVAVIPAIFKARRTVRANQWSMGIGTMTSAVGLIFMAVSYPPAFTGSRSARALRDGSEAGERRALARAEALLRDTAKGERFGRSWLSHVGGALVNLAAGLVLWLALDLPLEAGLQFGVGMVLSETQIWTQPTDAIRDWAAYQAAFPASAAALPALPQPAWSFTPFPGGLGLAIRY